MDTFTIEHIIQRLLTTGLGFDLSDPNLAGTPKRIAEMYVNEFFCGVGREFDDFSLFPNTEKYDQLIVSEQIEFVSICSHHFLPFQGKAWFGYIPGEHLVGISKLSRIVTHYAARPQLQEKLSHEILNRFVDVIKPRGAMLIIKARHSCQSIRGAKQPEAIMTTSAIYGLFEQQCAREEMLNIINTQL